MLSKLLQWVKDLPNTLKVLVGLISTAIAFVILLRANLDLGVVTLSAIVFVAAFSYLAHIASAKSKPAAGFSLKQAGVYKYPLHRRWALAGLAILALTCILTFTLRPTRHYIFAALKGTKEVPRADVLIAEFDDRLASKKFEISKRMRADLERELQRHDLTGVRVGTLPSAITSLQGAKEAAEQAGSKVVVWGWYDDLGVTINLYTPEPSPTGGDALRMKEVSWTQGANAPDDTSFKIRQQLPNNITFLSLFIIGNFHYQNNEYQKGYQAFDAAMGNLPKDIGLDNESLLHFFYARNLAASGGRETERVICSYAKAIELNPKFAAAYNNLGIVAAELYIAYDEEHRGDISGDHPDFELAGNSKECLNKIGSEGYEDLFAKALELQPESAVFRYNQLATEWRLYLNAGSLHYGYDINAILDDIIRKDPSIPGAHVMRGVLAFDEGEELITRTDARFTETNVVHLSRLLAQVTHFDDRRFRRALDGFTTASKLMPKSAELHINIGKVYLRRGMHAEAGTEFEKALSLAPHSGEARLALADVAVRQGQIALALQHLNAINPKETDPPLAAQSASPLYSSFFETAAILKSRIYFEAGDIAGALEALHSSLSEPIQHIPSSESAPTDEYDNSPLVNYLLSLLHTLSSDVVGAQAHLKKKIYIFDPLEVEGGDDKLARDARYHENATPDLAWDDIAMLCVSSGADFSAWGERDQCLPQDLNQRLRKVYDITQNRIAYRIFYRQEVMLGPALCPYVFTYDMSRGGWSFDTTIIYGLNRKELETIQSRSLRRFDGRLIVREVEPEVSHLDQISVVVRDRFGRSHTLPPRLKTLRDVDGEYLILRQGDEVRLVFDGFERIDGATDFRIEATGYYVPLR